MSQAAKDDRELKLVSIITCPCPWERPAAWLQSMTKTHKQMSALMHTDGTTGGDIWIY